MLVSKTISKSQVYKSKTELFLKLFASISLIKPLFTFCLQKESNMADLQGFFLPFIICLVSLLVVQAIFRRTRIQSRLPPSPPALPIIGHLHLLAPIPHQAIYKLSSRYGPLIHFFLGSVPCVVACSSEIAKELLKTHENAFSSRPKMLAVDYLTYGSAGFIFTPYGPYWKFMKKLCMSELLGARTLNQLLPVRSEEIRRFIQMVLTKANAKEAVDVGLEINRLTNHIMSRMTMSQRCSDNEADEVRELVQSILELCGKFNLADCFWFCKNLDLQGFGKKTNEARKTFDAMMERIIKEHEETRKLNKETSGDDAPKDLLDILLTISEDESSEVKLTRENIKAFMLVNSLWHLCVTA